MKQKQINQNWKKFELGEVGEIITGNTPPRAEKENYASEGTPWIKPPNLNKEKWISKSEEYLSEDGQNKSRMLPRGAVIVSCIGNIGKVAIADCKLSTNQQINSIIPNENVDSDDDADDAEDDAKVDAEDDADDDADEEEDDEDDKQVECELIEYKGKNYFNIMENVHEAVLDNDNDEEEDYKPGKIVGSYKDGKMVIFSKSKPKSNEKSKSHEKSKSKSNEKSKSKSNGKSKSKSKT